MKALILGLALACCAVPAWAETQDDLTPEQLKAIAEEAARKAEKDTSDGWQDERVAVDLQVVEGDWLTVPFEQRFFDYSPARLKAEWPNLMRAMRVPYPDAEYLRKRFDRFPVFREELGDDFDGDFEKLSANILEGWRLFFRGDFRAAKDHSVRYGAFGKLPGYLSQLIYAVYLCPSREEKLELLKDISNQVADYVEIIHDIKDDPEFSQDYLMLRLGYANAIARIAEEVTPANAIINNYFSR